MMDSRIRNSTFKFGVFIPVTQQQQQQQQQQQLRNLQEVMHSIADIGAGELRLNLDGSFIFKM